MTIHRFFIDPASIQNGRVFMPIDTSQQITKVLRLKKGDTIVVLDGSGMEFEIELDQMISSEVSGKIVSEKPNNGEPKVLITLYQALIPKDKLEMVLQKGTEIGIAKFVPVETKRSLIKMTDLKPEKFARFQRIIQEASEQSERAIVPTLEPAIKFNDAIEQAAKEGSVLIAWEREQETNLKTWANVFTGNQISIFIGPEGGFEEQEIEFAKNQGAVTVSLGSRILRAETAGLVMAANVLFSTEPS